MSVQRVMWSNETERLRPMFGRTWSEGEHKRLLEMWAADLRVEQIAHQLGRPLLGVLIKLEKMGQIRGVEKSSNHWTFKEIKDNPCVDIKPQSEEKVMNIQNTEMKFTIKGQEGSRLTDLQILNIVQDLELQVDNLSSIRTPSKKREALVLALQEDINKIVAYLDAR